MKTSTSIRINKIMKHIPLIIILAVLAFWLFSILWVEAQTAIHMDEFNYPDDIASMSGDVDYLKVLKYSDYALVYFVSGDHSVGNTAQFRYINNQWEFYKWNDTVWSKTGSAEGFVWPYLWHSGGGVGMMVITLFLIILLYIPINLALFIVDKVNIRRRGSQ